MSTIDILRQGVSDEPSAGRAAGIEIRQDLDAPHGQPVMPPSYEEPLEIHARHIDGLVREVIELDSIGSSANRVEEGLLEEYRAGRYPLPVSKTTIEAGGQSFEITTLEAPHRIFDAWIRLAVEADCEQPFETTAQGQELSLAHAGAMDPILETSAHDLLFGVWDSHRTGPGGQVRIARSFTSTVLGFDPCKVVTTAARRDPLNLGEEKALKTIAKGMKLSEQGLSSIPPQRRRNGVSIREARFVGFLSFASLRRLRFKRYDNAEVRVLLAALCLHGLTLRETAGWHLRSGCDLIATSEMRFEVVHSGSGDREQLTLSVDDTRALLAEAADRAGVQDRGVRLVGGPHLTPLVKRSIEADRSAKGA